jgi:hypothetical protein
MREIGSVYVGDGPKLMGGGIEAMTYAGLTPVVGIGVIDPFLGSGTTAVACAELGVPFIGYEIVEEYAEIASERVKEQKQ